MTILSESKAYLRWAAGLRESLRTVRPLDYPHEQILMRIDSRKQLSRLRACAKEPETVEWIHANVVPGTAFFDVGANVGAYSLVAAAAAKGECTVFAFEPSFATFAALSENIALNGRGDVITPLHVALGRETAIRDFRYSSMVPGAAPHNLQGSTPGYTDAWPLTRTSLQTISYRLDELVTRFGLPYPEVLKIDVDGGEISVLSGAEGCLADRRLRTVLVEVNEELYPDGELHALLGTFGFTETDRHRERRADVPDHQYNSVFFR
ncbi:hypothetical protein GCM10009557_17780 [Virgisporangium ochraceum]|uniref:Methyltransferase FkbM domain-containing protein n=1 Tax=Virgisporangium ochraceum TaxID=65505 RepID=A0A8J4A2J5_9ACTN|nr:FkbM family methyltransferase [Virgisporangium ochraceum]GIJ72675.1 hypothetical protein Voc01_075920 [Virgisporangium ochraceum]